MIEPESSWPNRTRIRRRVREFVIGRTGEDGLADDADLFACGLVNSLFALELITFLEREFEITIEVADLHVDNFRSIAACAGYAARRRRDRQPE